MISRKRFLFCALLGLIIVAHSNRLSAQTAVPLPAGVKPVWDLAGAFREATSTRERICINGLWRWQPAGDPSDTVPVAGWGYFKVPGCWPGITDYMQKDSHTLFAPPNFQAVRPVPRRSWPASTRP